MDTCETADCITNVQIPNIRSNASEFSELQSQINTKYHNTNNLVNNYNANLKALDPRIPGKDIYKFNDPNSYIPDKYVVNQPNSKPNFTIDDGIKHDLDQLIFQQNSIYILGTLTAATLIIAGIILAR